MIPKKHRGVFLHEKYDVTVYVDESCVMFDDDGVYHLYAAFFAYAYEVCNGVTEYLVFPDSFIKIGDL